MEVGPRNDVDLWANESRGLAISISGLVIATLSVILRFVARMKNGCNFGADDWMILPSLLCYYAFSISAIWGATKGGLGIDFVLLPPPQAIATGKGSYIMPIFSVPTISFAKLSIICLYHRVFAT
ncbi:hypothetical protein BDV41DRAFT_215148 [Aspergillus transmontanensis]|uniref:Rhodopsin domain-containing protein n=1 Tax=Aspergillus transmontanensis TaxID=1034304 RepID=A0A5N6W1S3_9EURO|nr:hypothetical protein BDV41DRAFT_215148 [Aspergillus transmontanensis]